MKVQKDNNNIILNGVKDFNLAQTLECGQCFHFDKIGDNEYGLTAFGKFLHITQDKDVVTLYDTSMDDYENVWKSYFDMDTDYGKIKKKLLSVDDKLRESIETMDGVRILNQDFFETLISFIISQNKQIPHIKKIVHDISKSFGEKLGEINGIEFYGFPDVKVCKKISENDLKELKTGFRAPYIMDAIEKVNSGIINEREIEEMDDEHCEEKLCLIKGVGTKVANCTMLFGLKRTAAFPVDVWIKRIMEYIYFDGQDTPKEIISAFAKEHFGEYGGYAQQYLFYYGKTVKMGIEKKK